MKYVNRDIGVTCDKRMPPKLICKIIQNDHHTCDAVWSRIMVTKERL